MQVIKKASLAAMGICKWAGTSVHSVLRHDVARPKAAPGSSDDRVRRRGKGRWPEEGGKWREFCDPGTFETLAARP